MAQHDYVISNDTGANVRADINNVLQAILTNNAGATQPSATQAGMFWGDTSNASTYYLKIRNHTNDGWVSLYAYDVATKTIQAMVNGSTASSLIDAKVSKVSSTDNAIVRFDGTSGAVQNSSVVIDDSGSLGVGTTSPQNKFQVFETSTTTPYTTTGTEAVPYCLASIVRDDSTTNYTAALMNFNARGVTGTSSIWYIGNDGGTASYAGNFVIGSRPSSTGYVERMRIDSSGNVGIGTSSPSSGYKLDVIGFGCFGNGSDSYCLEIGADSTYGYVMSKNTTGGLVVGTKNASATRFLTNNIERFRISSSGAVGIGTNSPSYLLHLSSDSAAKPSTNTWTISSDERLKENIELADLDRCYEIVKTIPLKRYTWKDSVYTQEQVSDRSKLGWIANDVQTVFPKAVNTHSQQLATFKMELKDVEEQKLISEAIVGQEEIKDEDGNIIQEFIEAKEAVYETITVQKEEKVYDVLDDCLDLNSDQIYAVMYGAIQKLQLTVESLTARIEALEAK